MKLLLLLFLTLPLPAQTAKVIQLSPSDATEAKQLHDDLAALQKKSDDFQDAIRKKYLTVGPQVSPGLFTRGTQYKPGWSSDFEFSDDFKFIVPKGSQAGPAPLTWSCPSYFTTPDTGTWTSTGIYFTCSTSGCIPGN